MTFFADRLITANCSLEPFFSVQSKPKLGSAGADVWNNFDRDRPRPLLRYVPVYCKMVRGANTSKDQTVICWANSETIP